MMEVLKDVRKLAETMKQSGGGETHNNNIQLGKEAPQYHHECGARKNRLGKFRVVVDDDDDRERNGGCFFCAEERDDDEDDEDAKHQSTKRVRSNRTREEDAERVLVVF